MNNKKTFFLGTLLGIVVAIVANNFITNANLVYRKLVSKNLTKEQKIKEIEGIVKEHYIDSYDKDLMENTMYKGMLASLKDPYSYYMTSEEFKDYIADAEGNYVGIGIMINITKDEKMNINKIFPSSPAEKGNLKVGDKIIKVDDVDITLDTYKDAVASIKGKEGSIVNLTIYRENEDKTMVMPITRKRIEVPTVEHRLLDNNIGYISISQFDGVTYEQFKQAFEELSSAKGLIIDVRNNPGGYLTTVNKIADMLVPKGIITYLEDKNGNKEYHYSDENAYGKPLVLLVNGNSASASEVLSGAVKDFKVGKLVGENTFGKGIVQNMYTLSDGSGVKVTIAKYFTPNGICIHGKGILPDYVIKNDEKSDKDLQLEKAIDVINNW